MHGAKMTFKAQKADFPVSVTEAFFDSDYKLVTSDDYDVAHRFALDYSHTTISMGASPREVDLGDSLSDLVRRYNADAVVNLKVTADSEKGAEVGYGLINLIIGLPTLGFLGFGNVTAIVEGDVVKMKDGPRAAPTRPAPPPPPTPAPKPETPPAVVSEEPAPAAAGPEFFLQFTSTGSKYGPFRYVEGGRVALGKTVFLIDTEVKPGKRLRFLLKSELSGKQYGPFTFRNGETVSFGSFKYTVITAAAD